MLIDLGFIDDDQLWELLDEAKTTGQRIGEVAAARGLINEEQLLQALADQSNLKTVNLIETKPTPEALALVPETMATVYKILPISYRDNVLTIAIGDPSNLGRPRRSAQLARLQGSRRQPRFAAARSLMCWPSAIRRQGREHHRHHHPDRKRSRALAAGRGRESSIDLDA